MNYNNLDNIHEKLCPDLRKLYRPDYMKAMDVLKRFDLGKIEKREALFCIHEIVNLVKFPELRHKEGNRVRLEAENLVPKILGIKTDQVFHKEKIFSIIKMLEQGKSIEEIAKNFK